MGSTPRRVIPKTIKKKNPLTSLLGTQYLGVDFGGGVRGEPMVLKHWCCSPLFHWEGWDVEDKRILHDVTVLRNNSLASFHIAHRNTLPSSSNKARGEGVCASTAAHAFVCEEEAGNVSSLNQYSLALLDLLRCRSGAGALQADSSARRWRTSEAWKAESQISTWARSKPPSRRSDNSFT